MPPYGSSPRNSAANRTRSHTPGMVPHYLARSNPPVQELNLHNRRGSIESSTSSITCSVFSSSLSLQTGDRGGDSASVSLSTNSCSFRNSLPGTDDQESVGLISSRWHDSDATSPQYPNRALQEELYHNSCDAIFHQYDDSSSSQENSPGKPACKLREDEKQKSQAARDFIPKIPRREWQADESYGQAKVDAPARSHSFTSSSSSQSDEHHHEQPHLDNIRRSLANEAIPFLFRQPEPRQKTTQPRRSFSYPDAIAAPKLPTRRDSGKHSTVSADWADPETDATTNSVSASKSKSTNSKKAEKKSAQIGSKSLLERKSYHDKTNILLQRDDLPMRSKSTHGCTEKMPTRKSKRASDAASRPLLSLSDHKPVQRMEKKSYLTRRNRLDLRERRTFIQESLASILEEGDELSSPENPPKPLSSPSVTHSCPSVICIDREDEERRSGILASQMSFGSDQERRRPNSADDVRLVKDPSKHCWSGIGSRNLVVE